MSIHSKGKTVKRNEPLDIKKEPTNELISWYNQMPDYLKPKISNPCFKHHKISLPCRILIVGTSGSGKTSLLLDMIYRMPKTFSHIILCSPMADEPLYAYLRSRLRDGEITVCESIDKFPKLEEIEQDEGDHTLVVFDDIVTQKNQRPIEDIFIRCRKKPASVCYLSQSYFSIPKLIRQQASHIWLRKMSGLRDIKLVMSDFNVADLSPQDLWKMYSHCVEQGCFLNIAVCDDEKERFRNGYLEVLDPDEFKTS